MLRTNLSWMLMLVLVISSWGQSTKNRYMIHFTDKEGSPYSLNNPSEYLSDEAIDRKVKFNIRIDSLDLPVNMQYVQGLKDLEIDVFYTTRWFNGALVQMESNLFNTVMNLPYVSDVEYIAKGEKLTEEVLDYEIPDSFEPQLFKMASSELQVGMLNADDMIEAGFTGKGITIAVLDGGFIGAHQYEALSHIYENNRLIDAWDFVTNSGDPFLYSGHGTAVLSTITADYPDFEGTAKDANVMLFVTEDVSSEFRVEEYNWLLAAERADQQGVDIIHSSLGYSTFNDAGMNYSYDDLDGETAVVTQAANIASEKGILVVTSAGNEGDGAWRYITAPGDAKNIITVGSITSEYEISDFSSVGPTVDGRIKPDVVSLGTNTAIMAGSGGIYGSNGTSYAAPLIAGLAAGLWEANPDWNSVKLANALRFTASRALSPDSLFGYGVPDYLSAQNGRVMSVSDIISDQVIVYPNPFSENTIYIESNNDPSYFPMDIELYDTKGSLLVNERIHQPPVDNIIAVKVDSKLPGIYILRLSSDLFSKQVKLLKY